MASFEWIIILLVNILITIDSFVIESNHNIYTTQASDSPSIQNPIEGFGDFHYPLDPEDVERRQLEEEKHDSDQRLHSINKDLKNTNQNKSQDNSSYYFSGSDRNYNKISESLDNSSETKFHIGFAGDVHYEEVEGCYCRDDRSHHRTEIFGLEVVCRCSGESVTQIPTNLTQELTRLSMISLGLEVLHSDAFHKYENLTDLYMESMKKLRLIESGVFLNLAHLRTVYIKFAPLLTHIPEGVFLGTFPKLRILRIIQTGLETMPVLNYFNTNGIISMIDFDSNRIRNLTSHSITVKAEIMNIDYNMIECVQNWAFHGSEIAKLSLKGNKNLVHLQEKAFEGLKYLREL